MELIRKGIPSGDYKVYRHVRLDTNKPFYVGIGLGDRPNVRSKALRSKWWHRIVNKTEYRVDIIFDGVSKEFAVEKEIELIKLYGRRDKDEGSLINLTDGGGGLSRYSHTEDTKKKISEARKGMKFTKEHREAISSTLRKRKVSEVTRKKMSEARLSKRLSQETKDKIARKIGKAVINTETGEEFCSIREAAKTIDVCESGLRNRLSGKVDIETPFKFK